MRVIHLLILTALLLTNLAPGCSTTSNPTSLTTTSKNDALGTIMLEPAE